jgi:hypothetical protein
MKNYASMTLNGQQLVVDNFTTSNYTLEGKQQDTVTSGKVRTIKALRAWASKQGTNCTIIATTPSGAKHEIKVVCAAYVCKKSKKSKFNISLFINEGAHITKTGISWAAQRAKYFATKQVFIAKYELLALAAKNNFAIPMYRNIAEDAKKMSQLTLEVKIGNMMRIATKEYSSMLKKLKEAEAKQKAAYTNNDAEAQLTTAKTVAKLTLTLQQLKTIIQE